jgi:hypothetical protein
MKRKRISKQEEDIRLKKKMKLSHDYSKYCMLCQQKLDKFCQYCIEGPTTNDPCFIIKGPCDHKFHRHCLYKKHIINETLSVIDDVIYPICLNNEIPNQINDEYYTTKLKNDPNKKKREIIYEKFLIDVFRNETKNPIESKLKNQVHLSQIRIISELLEPIILTINDTCLSLRILNNLIDL